MTTDTASTSSEGVDVRAMLLERCIPVPESGCWLWLGGCGGYGHMRVNGVVHRAHRLSYETFTGKTIPAGMLGCHKCDTPSCINPDHIFPGTAADNAHDRDRKGHHIANRAGAKNPVRRDAHHQAKLTANAVEQIKRMLAEGDGQRHIARSFGVSQSLISGIKNQLLWTDLRMTKADRNIAGRKRLERKAS